MSDTEPKVIATFTSAIEDDSDGQLSLTFDGSPIALRAMLHSAQTLLEQYVHLMSEEQLEELLDTPTKIQCVHRSKGEEQKFTTECADEEGNLVAGLLQLVSWADEVQEQGINLSEHMVPVDPE